MIAAFLIGFVGSIHCAAMCGPLMITFTKHSGKQSLYAFLLYHSGRLITYSAIGLLIGALSLPLYFFQFQKVGSLLMGASIILVYIFPKFRNKVEGLYYHSPFFQFFKQKMVGFYAGKFRWFASGVMNGLLPCGLVYLAAAGAVLSGGFFVSFQFMLLFGLGTLPALIGVAFLSKRTPVLFKRMANLTTPIALLSGVLLIFRGITVQNPDLNELLRTQIMDLMTVCGF